MPVRRLPITAVARKRISLVFALVLSAALVSFPAYASTETELEDARERYEAARTELTRVTQDWQDTEARLAEAQDAAAAARAEISRLVADLAKIQESVNERAAAAYMSGGSLSVGALLTSDSLQDAADRLQYTMSVVQGDTDLANQLAVSAARLRWQREKLQSAAEEEQLASEELEDQKAELSARVADLADVVDELKAELAREEEVTIGLTPSVAVTGSGAIQTCPVNGATSFVDSFGDPRPGGRSHEGIDLIAGAGTPVVAVAPGVARSAGSYGGLGVVVEHANGDWTFYAHLGTVATGPVSAGSPIGSIGSSGVSVTHLHFEYHPSGGPAVNPYSALLGVC